MKITDLVSLDCTDGSVKRYRRTAGNRPRETGRLQFAGWNPLADDIDWQGSFWAWLQRFRTGYQPPEDPGPRPTAPLRTARAA